MATSPLPQGGREGACGCGLDCDAELSTDGREPIATVDDEDDENVAEFAGLLNDYPEEERAAVMLGLYFDADGRPQTYHRRLRPS